MIITPKDVIKLAKGNMSNVAVSKLMGKNDNYVSMIIAGRSIGSQPMVDILDALGYDTIARNRETREETRISPSREDMIVPYSITLQLHDATMFEKVSALVEKGEFEKRLKDIIS